jgi:redox-sensitive bicupin YhaK (pirin superfamily)
MNDRVPICHSESHNLAIANVSTHEFEAWVRPDTKKGLAPICEIIEDANLMAGSEQKRRER